MTDFPILQDLADPVFDPFLVEGSIVGSYADPYPNSTELRAEGVVVQDSYRASMDLPTDIILPRDAPQFIVPGYDEFSKAAINSDHFSNHHP